MFNLTLWPLLISQCFMWFGSHFTVVVTRWLLLLSRISLLVINLLTIWIRVREKRQGMKLIGGPIYFHAVLRYYERFFHEIHSNNSLRDKMYGGPLFLFKMKISVLKMVTNWLLTLRFMNAFTWLNRKLTLRLTSESFLSFSAWFWDCFKLELHIHPDTGQILPCCFRFNWMVIVECYTDVTSRGTAL